MSKLRPVALRELIRRLRVLGFQGPYQDGKHPFLVRGAHRLPVPNPHEGRLVKALKVYLRDSGIVHALLGIQDYNALAGHPEVGASWEGFAIENLLALRQKAPSRGSTGQRVPHCLRGPSGHTAVPCQLGKGPLSYEPRR